MRTQREHHSASKRNLAQPKPPIFPKLDFFRNLVELSVAYREESCTLNGDEVLCSGYVEPASVEILLGLSLMAEGTIKRLTDKGFGFIDTGTSQDMFFHSSNVEGVRYDELREGQQVSYTEGRGPKGPRAENVRPV